MSKLLFNPLSGNFDIVYNKAEEIEFTPDVPANFSTTVVNVDEALNTLAGDSAATKELIKEPTGFPNRTDSVMAFDDVTREFTIDPVGASFDVYIKGHSFTKTISQSVVLSDDPGNHYIYFDVDGILQSTISFDPSLFENNAFVSIIYWNTNTDTHSYFADERHGLVMDGATHAYLHTVFGARYLNGLALQNFSVDGSGDFSSDAQFQGDVGKIRDEDILIDLPLTSNIPVLFREGLQWRKKAADTYPIIYNGTAGYTQARLPYNQFTGGAWQLTQVAEGDFVLSHIFATNDIENPYVAILGVNSYTTIPSARAGAESEISSLSGLPFAEFVAVGTVIFQTSTAYTNIPKARVRSAAAGENYVDFRGEQLYTPSGVATSHSLLSSLSSDDHPQYYNEARGDARYVTKAGDTMTGPLSIEDATNFTSYSTTQVQIANQSDDHNATMNESQVSFSGTVVDLYKEVVVSLDSIRVNEDDNVSGALWRTEINPGKISLLEYDGLGGPVLPALPVDPQDLTCKKYVDDLAKLSVISPIVNTTLTPSDKVVLCSNTIFLTLPLASDVITTLCIKNIGFGVVTIEGSASETIDGNLTYDLTNQWDSITLVSNGTGWFIL
jgi:hypothetical protein